MSADVRAASALTWLGWAAAVALGVVVALWACTRPNAAYCDDDTPCPEGMACNSALRECIPVGRDGGRCEPGDCPAQAPICDEASGQCRSCAAGAAGGEECAALDPDTPICRDGMCVQCEGASDCPADAPACESSRCAPCEDGSSGDAVCSDRDEDAPFCLEGACVACQDDVDCSGDTPVCEVSEGACRGCESGSECGSGVCDVFSGVCAEDSDILFVDGDAGEDGEGCGSSSTPCATISGEAGALAQAAGDPVFLQVQALTGGERYRETIAVDQGTVVIAGGGAARGADGARIENRESAPIVAVEPGTSVHLEGLRLSGDIDIDESAVTCDAAELSMERVEIVSAQNHGVLATGCGLDVRDAALEGSEEDQLYLVDDSNLQIIDAVIRGGDALGVYVEDSDLLMHRSRIEGNGLGGIHIANSVFELVNNVIVDNGSEADSEIGGVRVWNSTSIPEESSFAFNTVARNRASSETGFAHGVDCDDYVAQATSNIVYFGFGGLDAVSDDCAWQWRYSNIEGGVDGGPGDNNLSQDPSFEDAAGGEYRITSDSPCVDRGEPDTDVDFDVTGGDRPAGEAPDCGAYEYR